MLKFILLLLFATSFVGTAQAASVEEQMRAKFGDAFKFPEAIPYADENPYSIEKAALGKVIFFDQRLSQSRNQSCASCHHPGLGWEMGIPLAMGAQLMPRKSQTLLNVAWNDAWFWDGRSDTLSGQFHTALTSPKALAMSVDELEKRILAVPGYKPLFEKAFADHAINEKNIGLALDIFERGIVSGPSAFDRWMKGDAKALSPDAKAGALVFAGKANCIACHSGFNFTDNGFHDIGIDDADIGRGKQLALPSMQHAFKTPTLRSIAQRAPYTHAGHYKSLEEVVDLYDEGGEAKRPSLAPEVKKLHLKSKEKKQLVEFLKSLTGDDAPMTIPQMPM